MFRQKEEEERKNKMAALAAVRAAKAAMGTTVIMPEEIKGKPLPTVTVKTMISPFIDDKGQASKEL